MILQILQKKNMTLTSENCFQNNMSKELYILSLISIILNLFDDAVYHQFKNKNVYIFL